MVSVIIMTNELDAGPIVGQRKISLSGDMIEIFSQITEGGISITRDILINGLSPVEQDDSLATTCKRREPKDSEISSEEIMTKSANYLHNKIRMLQDPYPNAFIRTADGKKLYLTASRLDD